MEKFNMNHLPKAIISGKSLLRFKVVTIKSLDQRRSVTDVDFLMLRAEQYVNDKSRHGGYKKTLMIEGC